MSVPPDVSGARILIIDDEPANVLLMERALQKSGYTALTSTTSAARGLGLFREVHPDLVILDVHMPEVNGLVLLDRLRAEIPADSYLPVLVMTADVQPEVKLDALARGAKDFLTRPLDLREVLLRVRTLLEARFLFRNIEVTAPDTRRPPREVPAERPLEPDRLEGGLVYFRCRSCNGEHPAPIQFDDSRALLRTHLTMNVFLCPLRKVGARYSSEHLFWRAFE